MYIMEIDKEDNEVYYFKEIERAKVLQGRTITYLAKEKLFMTPAFVSSVLKGHRGCSLKSAAAITRCISWDAKILDYFYFKEKGE